MGKKVVVATALMALALVPAAVSAQVCDFDMWYDPATVTTVTGTVVTTIDYNPGNPSSGPQAVIISSRDRPHTVFLGPGRFVSQVGLRLMSGDTITVTGSQRSIAGRNYIVASTVSTPSQTFRFRTEAGLPLYQRPPVVTPPPLGRGPGQVPAIPFDPNHITAVSGRIISVSDVRTGEDVTPSAMVVIRPTSGYPDQVTVLLGPRFFLQQNSISLARDEFLWVRGSSVLMDSRRVIVATRVSQGTLALNVRDPSGFPLWPAM